MKKDMTATRTGTNHSFDKFEQQRETLVNLMAQQEQILSALGMAQWNETIVRLKERLLSNTFKVLVLGEFKRGKSTFINALLRAEVLPAFARPCTAIINEIKWGKEPQAVLHFKSSSNFKSESLKIPVNELEKYITIPFSPNGDEADSKQYIRDSQYDKVEVFWPLELCRRGVEIIDSPGLNETEVRHKITMDYLASVDAVLFVLSCSQLGSYSEKETIKNILLPAGHEDIFFICNRYDEIKRPSDREDIRRFGISLLAPLTRRGAERVYFVSALEALEGYLSGDSQRIRDSNLPEVESALERFLAADRGRIKLIRPINELRTALRDARNTIPNRMAMLKTDHETLQKRYTASQESLEMLEKERNSIVEQVTAFRAKLTDETRENAKKFYTTVVTKIPGWAAAIANGKEDTKESLPSRLSTEEDSKKLNELVIQHLCELVESEMAGWLRTNLQPLADSRMDDFQKSLNDQMHRFLERLEEVRREVAHGSRPKIAKMPMDKMSSPLDKILARSQDLNISRQGATLIATNGYAMVFNASIPSILMGTLALCLSSINPFILAGLVFTSAARWFALANRQVNQAVIRVGEEFAEHIRKATQEESAKIADVIADNIRRVEAAIDQGLGKQVQDVREQVESVLMEMQKGQANVAAKIEELTHLPTKLDDLDEQLGELTEQVIS